MLKRGFTLIEVLVTLVILMFGLLGIAGLMAKGQRASFEAFQRQQALSLASDMAERMTSNAFLATTYAAGAPLITPLGLGSSYNDLMTGAITDCGNFQCLAPALAAYDLAQWDGLLNGYSEQQVAGNARVGGIVNALGCIEDIANTAATCPAPPTNGLLYSRSLRISVAWQGNDDTVIPTASTCGANQYTAETKRRVVALNMLLLQACP